MKRHSQFFLIVQLFILFTYAQKSSVIIYGNNGKEVKRKYILNGSHIDSIPKISLLYSIHNNIIDTLYESPFVNTSENYFLKSVSDTVELKKVYSPRNINEPFKNIDITRGGYLTIRDNSFNMRQLKYLTSKKNPTMSILKTKKRKYQNDYFFENENITPYSDYLFLDQFAYSDTKKNYFFIDKTTIQRSPTRYNSVLNSSLSIGFNKSVQFIGAVKDDFLISILQDGTAYFVQIDKNNEITKEKISVRHPEHIKEFKINGGTLNPLRKDIVALICQGYVNGVLSQFLATGQIDYIQQSINISTIEPQQYNSEKIISQCRWSPDGKYLSIVITKQELIEKNIGQLLIIPILHRNNQPRYFNQKIGNVKLSTPINWIGDGSGILYVSIHKNTERLTYTDRQLKNTCQFNIRLPKSSIAPENITAITSFSYGKMNGESVPLCKVYISVYENKRNTIYLLRKNFVLTPLNERQKDRNSEFVNKKLNSLKEVLEFEKIVSQIEQHSHTKGLSITNTYSFKSKQLEKLYAHVIQSDDDNSSKDLFNKQLHTFTVQQLRIFYQQIGQIKPQSSISAVQKSKNALAIQKVDSLVNIIGQDAIIGDTLKNHIKKILIKQIVTAINQGKDWTLIFDRINLADKKAKEYLTLHRIIDDRKYFNQLIHLKIDTLVSMAQNNEHKFTRQYLSYLKKWQKRNSTMNKNFDISISQYICSHTIHSEEILRKQLALALNKYESFDKPRHFTKIFPNMNLTSPSEIYQFKKKKRVKIFLGILAGLALESGGIYFMSQGKNFHTQYRDETESIDRIQQYKAESKRNYRYGNGLLVAGHVVLGAFTINLISFSLKNNNIRKGK